jgi:16S rRNA (cytidine1402-2'-O)-methyltransferase
MLILVSTPIGNLSDISFRAIETLKTAYRILCEDTRHSSILTKHYGITTPLESFHKFSEASKEDEIVEMLKEGRTIALISDAGTPGICDPGERLVARCTAEQIPVSTIPGACALITALVCSGLPTAPFQFVGFLPKKESELIEALDQISLYPGTSLSYVSPHQIEDVIDRIAERSPDQQLVIARELTKKFEEFLRGKAKELSIAIKETPLKGEVVLLFDRAPIPEVSYWTEMSEQEHVTWIEQHLGIEKKEAIKQAAKERGLPKREFYKRLLYRT